MQPKLSKESRRIAKEKRQGEGNLAQRADLMVQEKLVSFWFVFLIFFVLRKTGVPNEAAGEIRSHERQGNGGVLIPASNKQKLQKKARAQNELGKWRGK